MRKFIPVSAALPELTGRVTTCQQGIDALGWAAGATVGCLGVSVGLRGQTREALDTLISWLPRAFGPARTRKVPVVYSLIVGGSEPGTRIKRFHILYRNFTQVARSLDLDVIERAFGRDLALSIGERAPRRVLVHAGVVAIGGGAVLIPGKSLSGKTTLTRALVEEGGGLYYSDEFAVIDPRGRVSPWAEPLNIRAAGSTRRGVPHSAASLGLKSGRGSLPVRLVVMTDYRKGQSFTPRLTARAEGALGLLEHTLPARRRPRAALRALTSAVARAQIIRGSRGEARAAARAILKYLAEPQGD